MYTFTDFKTKKALRDAVNSGKAVSVYQPNHRAMKTFPAFKLVSATSDERLWSYNSVRDDGRGNWTVESRDLYFVVQYKPYIWARPRLKGTRLFALENSNNELTHEFTQLWHCMVTTPQRVEKMVNCPFGADIRSIWSHPELWTNPPLFLNTITCGQIMLTERIA